MAAIKVHEFITLDGVVDTPTWTASYGFDANMRQAIARAMADCHGILLGRLTYEMFAPAWSARTAADDPGAPFMNDTTKYVVSCTLDPAAATWANTQVVGAYHSDTIRKLKTTIAGGLYVSGSGTLVRALLADGLVDELHLFVYPITLGPGPRLFTAGVPASAWSLITSESYDNSVTYLAYQTAANALPAA